ncbi:MAG: cache domain-containing protein [Lachnospiraceae bacterium]|jgi:methyl-accepting chemotaxis protein
MKLKEKILALSLVPVLVLGITMFLVAADRIANGIYDAAYNGMHATTLAVRDIFEEGKSGAYHMDEQGMLWKGDALNISQATNIVDHIKESTGIDVTIFWGDTRILTSIVDEHGARQINTKASAEVAERVLQNGETYYDRNIEILGQRYIVSYTPLYQENSKEIIGMIFLGTPQQTVSVIINKIRGQFLLIILCMLLFVTVIAYTLVSRIVAALKKNMELLDCISSGNLQIEVQPALVRRKDEIGDLAKNILNLTDALRTIVLNIRTKSEALNEDTNEIERISDNVYQVMKEVNNATQEMGTSCTTQAEDANQANSNVACMGDMIIENTTQITELHEISGTMKTGATAALEQVAELNDVMRSVKESIAFLSEQTSLTNESVAKISSTTELITAIASQTNLLSLNASIEAARAGEHGRGFSVVASEIQQLSEQSNRAAGEIQKMIANLNTNSTHTLDRVKEVQHVIEKQEENIQKTSEIFREVCNHIDQSASGMDIIMENSEKLEDIRTETVTVVQDSASLSEENSASIQEMMASIENIYQELGDISDKTKALNALSKEMTASVDVFHTS